MASIDQFKAQLIGGSLEKADLKFHPRGNKIEFLCKYPQEL